ncbi:S8 family peptidase [Clostridium guangxiense]|uniref:S8 family peptidase n=1 Tax=Clostridium guangxiense TaxID=1662055 RepID=UPI001E5B1D69|nr:S8 family serine peptidase [Clostridium guangxiense]MCD2347093.1 S8 family serine peptidase [Clostridium guangxiense]
MKKIKKCLCFLLVLTICMIAKPNYFVNAETISTNNIDLSITFSNHSINYDVEKLVTQNGGQVLSEFPEIGALKIKCSDALVPKILNCEGVDSISPSLEMKLPSEKVVNYNEEKSVSSETADLYEKYQWDIKKVTNNGESYKLGTGNHNVVVGIVDTGVDENHPDLKANILGGENFVPSGYNGDNTETGDKNDIQDRNGHGTHVAGTIAGNGRIKGVAPNIGIKSYRVFGKEDTTDTSIIVAAIIKATDDGVNVISLSLGGYGLKGKCFWKNPQTGEVKRVGNDLADMEIYKRAIQYAIDRNVVVVAAAGNEALNCHDKKSVTNYINSTTTDKSFTYEGLGYELPGTVKGVIGVSAVGPTNKLASYSNYGENFVDVTAPGGDLLNADGSDYYDLCLSSYINGGYAFAAGTSMATPKVSAIAALTICKYGNIGPKEISKKIYKSCEKLDNDPSGEYYGHGLVNAYNLLK